MSQKRLAFVILCPKDYKNYCMPDMYKSMHKAIIEPLYVKHEGKTTTKA